MFNDSEYHEALTSCMDWIARMENSIFVGQQVHYQDFYGTLKNVSLDKRMEMPVAEEMQMGFCIGLALAGFLPICIFQRMDFMYRAMDQICNHLSLLPEYSRGQCNPKVIIRATIGNDKPLYPGIQHIQDLTSVFNRALSFPVIQVNSVKEVYDAYHYAIEEASGPVMIIEQQRLYSVNKE